MSEQKFPREMAEAEFERFLDGMRLRRRFGKKKRDAEAQESMNDAREIFIESVMEGRVTVDTAGQATFTPDSDPGNPFTFHSPTGATIMAVDSKKESAKVAQTYAMLADVTQQPEVRFAKLPQWDMDVVMALSLLFFG